jgi:Ni/Co efflux regulator RcnB
VLLRACTRHVQAGTGIFGSYFSTRFAGEGGQMRKILLMAALGATTLSAASAADARHHGRTYVEVRHDRHDRHWNRHHRRGYTVYVAPRHDWRYRRVAVGYRLGPEFYGSRYYVTNYGLYGLRAPGRHLRWIRYGDDLLLVNTRTGRVVDVRPGLYY